MLKRIDKKLMGIVAVVVPLLIVFVVVVFRSGPMAPVDVTVTNVDIRSIRPVLNGIGVIDARFVHAVGPTAPGRVAEVLADAGDRVRQGDVLCEIDPVDLDERIVAQQSLVNEAERAISIARASLKEAQARHDFAIVQEERYGGLLKAGAASAETAEQKKQEAVSAQASVHIAAASIQAAKDRYDALTAEYRALVRQRRHLRLTAPVSGLVTLRKAEKGNSVVAGQTIMEMIDPQQLWFEARFDQYQATGLQSGLEARIRLRSRPDDLMHGIVFRVEPIADQVTEELQAKIAFTDIPEQLPPLGELGEVSISLQALPEKPVIPSAAIRRVNGKTGVWIVNGSRLEFREIKTGRTDSEGSTQVLEGLEGGETIVEYSIANIDGKRRITIKKQLSAGGGGA